MLALVLTGGAALTIGAITLRLGGHFLPLSTIAWGLSIALVFGNMKMLGSHTGLSNIPAIHVGSWSLLEPRAMYYLVWAMVGLAYLFCRNVLRSRTGRAMRGLRGGNILLSSVGADPLRAAYQRAFHVLGARSPLAVLDADDCLIAGQLMIATRFGLL
mgnify:CR=1 FL=1